MTKPDTAHTVDIEKWQGMQSNVDSHDAEPGATQDQRNATAVTPGQLTVRKGMIELSFEF